jgi:hypothetical protein
MSNSTIAIPRRALVSVLLVLAIAAVLVVARGGVSEGSTYVSDQSVTYQDFGGTIRNTGSGWYVLDDAGHEPDGITIGAVTSSSVQVYYPACSQIVSFIAAPDDTYAYTYSAVFGSSVGLTYAYIKGTIKDGSDSGYLPDPWDPTTDYSSSSNIWISGRCIPA